MKVNLLTMPALHVGHGRWQGATAQVRRSRRASMMVRSAQTVADEGDRQSQVWQRVSRYDTAFGASPLLHMSST